MQRIIQFDQELFLWLNGLHASWLDGPMWLFSTKWFWIPVYMVLLYALYRKYPGKQFLWLILLIALCVTLNDQIASSVFKNWIQRPRPTHTEGLRDLVHTVTDFDGREYRGGRFGFYSSHAANMFGVAMMYFLLARPMAVWKAIALFLWVGLVAYSRIYLGVHFPLDILTGAAMGVLIGWLCVWLFRIILRPRKSSLAA